MVSTLSPASRRAAWALFLLLPLLLTFAVAAHAQTKASSARTRTEPPLVTAAATAGRVRFAAPGGVVQLRLEVYDEAGRKLFDTEQRGGSVLDWHLRDGAGERVAEGTYLCVVTVKDLRGRITQRVGLAAVGAEGATVEPARAESITAAQAAAAGPVEEGGALAVVSAGEGGGAMPAAAVTHDGAEAQLGRTHGALSFRVGDFLSGSDREQMRLTEDGKVGIGTEKPEETLDVVGTVRATEGFRFADGTTLKAADGRLSVTNSAGDAIPEPNVAGTGTQNRLAKWNETGGAGTLTDSGVVEVSGNIGIGTVNPAQKLHVFGKSLYQNTGTAALFIVDRTDGKIASLGAGGLSATFAYDQTGIFKIESNTRASIAQGVFGTATGATTRFMIDGAGNVGVGTEAPAAKLDVNGGARFTPGGSGGAIQFGTPNFETGMTISNASTRADLRFDGDTFKLVAGPAGGPPSNFSGITVKAATGNVGIGTTDPTVGKLHVLAFNPTPAVYAESPNRGVWGVSTGSSYGVYGESVQGIGMQGVSTNNIGTTGASVSHIGVYGSTASGDITRPGVLGGSTGIGGVGVRGDGTTGVYGVSTNGVGVTGTSASAAGYGGYFQNTAGGFGLGVEGTARVIGGRPWTSSGWANALDLNNAAAIGWRANAAGQRFGIGQSGGGLYFFRTASDPGTTGSPADYDMVINDAGNVGIGTTTPLAPLHITTPSGGTVLRLQRSVNGDDHIVDFVMENFLSADDDGIFGIRTSAHPTAAAWLDEEGQWNNTSDRKLKTNIRPLQAVLSMVKQLPVVTYQFKSASKDKNQIGVIAQDVDKLFPEFTSRWVDEKGEATLGVNYNKFGVIALKAIQEQQALIEEQAARIESLEERVAELGRVRRGASFKRRTPRVRAAGRGSSRRHL